MLENCNLNILALPQVLDNEQAGIARDNAIENRDYGDEGIACLDSEQGQHKPRPTYHAINQSQYCNYLPFGDHLLKSFLIYFP